MNIMNWEIDETVLCEISPIRAIFYLARRLRRTSVWGYNSYGCENEMPREACRNRNVMLTYFTLNESVWSCTM